MPAFPGFVGSTYAAPSPTADGERTVNWFIGAVEGDTARARTILLPSPGFKAYAYSPDVNTRAFWSGAGQAVGIIGPGLYDLTPDGLTAGILTKRGTLAQDHLPATISYNGSASGQLFITSGSNGYCYNLATKVLTQVLTGDASSGAFLGNRFLAFNVLTGRTRFSALGDGLTWGLADNFSRSAQPDPTLAMVVDGNAQLWLIGEQSGEVRYVTSDAQEPYAPIPGAQFGVGIAGPWAYGIVNNSPCWVTSAKDGAGTVVLPRGYTPQKISTFAVDAALQSYARTTGISDAETLAYQADGHTVVCFSFPKANATWVLDPDLPSWTERGRWNAAANRFDMWLPRVHGYAFGLHLVGDRQSNTIAIMDSRYASELDGTGIRRVRRALLPNADYARRPIDRFGLVMDTGVGLSTGQGSNPQALLRVSDDAGQTWGGERSAAIGRMGKTHRRVYWNRLGTVTNGAVEVVITDPVPSRIVSAYLNDQEPV